MPTVPIDIAVDHIAKLGFDGLELTVIPPWNTELSTLDAAERTRIRRLIADAGLQLPAIAGHTSLLAENPEEHAANLARLHGAIDLCLDLEIDGVLPDMATTAGARPQDWDRLSGLLVERLHALGEYAAKRGVTVAIEPHVSQIIKRPENAVWLIDQVNLANVRLNFDISHFNVLGLPIEATVPLLAPLAVHTHVKDERGRAPNHDFLIPGEGEFNYVGYLKAMAAAGYTRFITAEVSVMVQRRPDYDPLAAATQSYQVLNQAFETAGIVRPLRARAPRR
ncbi:MAG: sugar phosphate isomerase/epimerase family protein [Chloroflexota bacterium]